MPTPQGLDPKAYVLTKAIALQENGGKTPDYSAKGGSGEHGAYQWIKPTWDNQAKQAGVNAAFGTATPEQQNKVAYTWVDKQLKAGKTPAQVASMWNAGEGAPNAYKGNAGTNSSGVNYDTKAYAEGVQKYAQKLWNEDGQAAPATPQGITADQTAKQQSGATFGATTGEGAMAAGLKTLGNVPSSLLNFAKGALDAVNPISTIGRLSQIPSVLGEIAGQKQTPGQLAGNLATGAYEAVVPQAGRELIAGDTTGAQRTVTNDPIGSVAPFVLGARGVAGLADSAVSRGAMKNYVQNIGENTANRVPIPQLSTQFTGAFDQAVSKVGGTGAKIVGAPFKLAGNVIGKTVDFGVKQATGLSGETRGMAITYGKELEAAKKAGTDRASLSDTVKTALDNRISSMGESQAAYKPIRAQSTVVKVDPNFIENAVGETAGVTFEKGKIKANGNSTVREARDIASLQTLYDFWKPYFKSGKMTSNLFLNFRQDLAKASGYGRDIGKSKPVENVANVVRGKLNTAYRNQISGLKELDAQTSAQIKDFKEVKKGLLDSNNQLTEGAINRIANATNKGRDTVLAKLEEASPGITHQIRIVKALEDIEKASENKVGTYGRAALGAGSLLTLNIPGIIATILAQPEVAVPILRQYGYAKPLVNQVLKSLKGAARNAGAQMNKPIELPKSSSKLPAVPKALLAVPDNANKVIDIRPVHSTVKDKSGAKSVNSKIVPTLDSVNPTGSVFAEYSPQARATMKLGDNITTLDKTSGGLPNELITIYRGAPINQKGIVAGDFITTNKQLAKDYAGDGVVLEKRVSLKDILDAIDEPLGEEYIYRPENS